MPSTSSIRSSSPAVATRRRPVSSISGLWSSPTTRQSVRRRARSRLGGPGRHVEHGVVRPHRNAGNKEPAPARILAEGEQSRVPVVGRSERCKELGVHVGRVWAARRGAREDLERIAAAAGPFAAEGEDLTGVLAAEPVGGGRVYLCVHRRRGHTWLALDDAGEPITDRELIRQAASLLALSEVAEDSAGGGELDDLKSRLVALRLTENPPGIDEAEEAIVGLQHVLGSTPRVATAAWLDEVGCDAAAGAGAGGFRPLRSPRR